MVLRAPQVLSYFNAGHHLAMYQVADHLRRVADVEVQCYDPTVETLTWKDIADDLYARGYDLVAVQNDLDGVDGLERLLRYVRALSNAKIATFGRLSAINPKFFQQFDLDAICETGDAESAIEALVASLDPWPETSLPGTAIRTSGGWCAPSVPGALLDPAAWPLPDPGDIPYPQYDALYSRDSRKFSGIPGRRELIVPVARGCPINCSYCEVPKLGGLRDRRLPVENVTAYISHCFAAEPFEYVSFYAPTFTINRRWVVALCESIADGLPSLSWKCCTTIHHLDEELVALMGRAGCVRISVGLETLDAGGMSSLPPSKRKNSEDLQALAEWCKAAGIELTCFVIVGLPGTTVDGTRRTMQAVRELGGRVRPTIYAPDERMSGSLSVTEMSQMNRQLLSGVEHLSNEDRRIAYALAYETDAPSRVPDAISPRAGQP